MKKSWVWWTLAFVVGVAVGWFAYASTGKDEALPVRADVGTPATSSQAAVGSSSSAAALQEPQAVPVRVQQAQLRDVSLSLEAHGALAANREVRLSPKVSGRVATVAVDVGDPVSEGQLLLTLEKDELEISVAQAEAAVAAARANLARIQAGARPEEIQQARAQVTQAASNLEQARTHLARITSLYESGAVSQAQLEQAQSQYEVAEAAHTAAVSQLQIVEQGPRDEDIRAVEAQLMQAEAGLAMAKLQLSHAELASTLDGIVADRLVQPGDMIGAGTPAFRIVQIDPVVVRIELGGRDIVRVRPGVQAMLTLDAFPHHVFTGTVSAVEAVASPQSRLFGVRIEVPNPDGLLKPGMSARVRLAVETRTGVVAVPDQAIQSGNEGAYVYVVEQGLANRRAVQVGLSGGGWTEIVEGLSPGEHVIVSGLTALSEGARVRITGSDTL